MDISADPCNDFHQYVCGKRTQNTFSFSNTQIYATTIMELGKTLEAGIDNMSSKSKAVQYLMNLFEEYANLSQRENLSAQPMRQLLKQVIGHEQWPLLQDNSVLQLDNSSSGICKTVEFLEFEKNWQSWKFLQSNKSTHLSDGLDLNVAQWMDSYVEASMVGVYSLIDGMLSYDKKTWNTTITILISQIDDASEEDFGDLFGQYREISKLTLDLEQWNTSVDYAIFELIDFNQTLSRILKSKPLDWLELPPSKRKTITLHELNSHSSSSFDWTLLLNKFASRTGAPFRYTDKDSVFVNQDQLNEFKPFTELIAHTPIRVLKNLVALQVLRNPRIKRLFDAPVNFEMFPSIRAQQQRLFLALLFVGEVIKNHHFSPILARLYVDKVGREQMRAARDQVIILSKQLRDTFSESVNHGHTWFDPQTRRNALDKLDSMKLMIAFPEWIFDDDILDEQCGFSQMQSNTVDSQTLIKGQYAASYLNVCRLKSSKAFRSIRQITQEDRKFIFSPIGTYAAYSTQMNALFTNSQLLNLWMFLNYVPALNYGNLGSIIGHEITHAFDSEGGKYDRYGERANWWTDSAREHFEKQTKCFVQQYDGLIESTTSVKINGTLTLAENIADNGGLNMAYRAFKSTLNQSDNEPSCPSSCPSLQESQFTPEQLFFISYGMIWCSDQEHSSTNTLKNGKHSPNRFRANVPLCNMAQFSLAFNCSIGSKMNPKHKCSIW